MYQPIADDPSSNPYAPPATSDLEPVSSCEQNNNWLTTCCVFHVILMAVTLALEAYRHETIVGTGPIFAVVGSIIAVLSRRKDRELEFYAGTSAPILTAFVVFLINYNGWSPASGDQPITIIISLYAAVVIPAFLAAIARQLQRA